jgi:hypothetical protein
MMRPVRLVRGGALLAAVLMLSGCAWIARVDAPRVNTTPEPTFRSRYFFTSDTGRYVVFDSTAIDLVEETENVNPFTWGGGVYLRDNLAKTTTLLVGHALLGPDNSVSKSVRFILVHRADSWYVLDRTTGVVGPVAFDAGGLPRVSQARSATISTSGRYVALREYQSTVVTTSISDLQNHTTKVLTTITPTTPNTEFAGFPASLSLSHNGSVLAQDTCLALESGHSGPSCVSHSLQIWDVANGTLQSARPDQSGPFDARLDGSGRYLAYWDGTHVQVLDRSTNTLELADVGFDGLPASGYAPSISADGRYVAFESAAGNLEPHTGNTVGRTHIYVRDLLRNRTVLADVSLIGPYPGGGSSAVPSISGDGRYVAFLSNSTYLTPDATTYDAYRLFVKAVSFPRIATVAPATGARGTTTHVTVTGEGFRPDISVLVRNATTPLDTSNRTVTETSLQFDVTIPAAAPTGAYDVYVYNPGGGPGSDTGAADGCVGCFQVTP